MNKKIIIFILILNGVLLTILVGIIYFNPSKKEEILIQPVSIPISLPISSVPESLNKYMSADGLYTFKYKNTWTLVRDKEGTQILTPTKILSDSSADTIVDIFSGDSFGYNPEEYQQLHIHDYTDSESKVINNHQVYITTYSGSTYTDKLYLVKIGTKIVTLQFRKISVDGEVKHDYSEYESDVNTIFDSILNNL